jgi:hypothetical protein
VTPECIARLDTVAVNTQPDSDPSGTKSAFVIKPDWCESAQCRLRGRQISAATDSSWPNSAGDISVGETADTNAADDENNLCDNSRRQAILQAFRDSACTPDVLITDGF